MNVQTVKKMCEEQIEKALNHVGGEGAALLYSSQDHYKRGGIDALKGVVHLLDQVNDPNNAAAEALKFYFEGGDEDPESFLRCWYEGDFETIRKEWPEAPEEVYIGADPLHPETEV